ncbi:hypothetical protein PanWU01x14_350360, partial [Parasponia andersonii]
RDNAIPWLAGLGEVLAAWRDAVGSDRQVHCIANIHEAWCQASSVLMANKSSAHGTSPTRGCLILY